MLVNILVISFNTNGFKRIGFFPFEQETFFPSCPSGHLYIGYKLIPINKLLGIKRLKIKIILFFG